MHTYVQTYIRNSYIHTYTHIHTHTYTYIHTYLHICICILNKHIYLLAFMRAGTHAHTQIVYVSK